MLLLSIDLAGVDWLFVAQLCALTFFSTLTVALVLMFAAALFFWAQCPDDLQL